MKHPAAPLLAPKLGRLRHTNDRGETNWLPLPGFLTAGMAPEQAESTNLLGQAICEALIETLDVDCGYVVISHDELEAKAQEMAEGDDEPVKGVTVHCNRCRAELFDLRLASEFVKANPQTLIDVLVAHQAVCQ